MLAIIAIDAGHRLTANACAGLLRRRKNSRALAGEFNPRNFVSVDQAAKNAKNANPFATAKRTARRQTPNPRRCIGKYGSQVVVPISLLKRN